MDLTGLSDANAYNWNGFTAGLQVSMSSSEGEGESSLARTETDIFSDEPGKEKKNGLTLQILFSYPDAQFYGLFTGILASFGG